MAEYNINSLVKKLKGKYGTIRVAEEDDAVDKEYISTSIKALDLALEGGIAWGYVTEVAGFSQSGKTTLLQLLLAHAQKEFNAVGIWFDREKAWFNKRAVDLGIDISKVIVISPEDIPTVIEANALVDDIMSSIPDDQYKFICIDSISAFAKTAKVDKSDMGKRALQIHDLFRMILKYTNDKTSVNFANHRYYKPEVMFGDNTTSGGGEGPKYYTNYRIQMEDRKQIFNKKENNAVMGNWIKATVNKTRNGPNYRHVVFPHYYEFGIPELGGYARLLVDRNYAAPASKAEFKSLKRGDFKVHGDDTVYDEFKLDELLEKHPELNFSEYPKFNSVNGKVEEDEDDDEFTIKGD